MSNASAASVYDAIIADAVRYFEEHPEARPICGAFSRGSDCCLFSAALGIKGDATFCGAAVKKYSITKEQFWGMVYGFDHALLFEHDNYPQGAYEAGKRAHEIIKPIRV